MKAFKETQLLRQLLPPACLACKKTGVPALRCEEIVNVPTEVLDTHLVKRLPCFHAGEKVGSGFEFSIPEKRVIAGKNGNEAYGAQSGIPQASTAGLFDVNTGNWFDETPGYFPD